MRVMDEPGMRRLMFALVEGLLDAGLTTGDIKRFAAEVQRRMGPGGYRKEWLTTMGAVIGEMGDRSAESAFLRALDALDARLN